MRTRLIHVRALLVARDSSSKGVSHSSSFKAFNKAT
jgi:hypothetical protein